MTEGEGAKPQAADERVSLQRRTFMRAVSRDAIHGAAVLMGASDAIQSIALRAVMATSPTASEVPSAAHAGAPSVQPTTGLDAYRRHPDGRLFVTDRSQLPDAAGQIACVDGSGLARLLARHAVGSGPVLGELTAYALGGTAAAVSSMDRAGRTNVLRATSAIIAGTRPASGALIDAVRRSTELWTTDGEASLADSLVSLGDTLSADLARAISAMAGHAAALTEPACTSGGGILFQGAFARLATGSQGAGTEVMHGLRALGVTPGVWISEGGPAHEGRNATGPDLAADGIRSTIVADAVVGSLIASGRVAAVMVFAERVLDDGTVIAPIGTYPMAVMAALHRVPLVVLAPLNSVGGSASAAANRVAPAGSGRPGALGTQLPDTAPLMDETPSDLVTAVITGDGPR